jgi:hypothetical protein
MPAWRTLRRDHGRDGSTLPIAPPAARTSALIDMNCAVQVDNQDEALIAERFLTEVGLLAR